MTKEPFYDVEIFEHSQRAAYSGCDHAYAEWLIRNALTRSTLYAIGLPIDRLGELDPEQLDAARQDPRWMEAEATIRAIPTDLVADGDVAVYRLHHAIAGVRRCATPLLPLRLADTTSQRDRSLWGRLRRRAIFLADVAQIGREDFDGPAAVMREDRDPGPIVPADQRPGDYLL